MIKSIIFVYIVLELRLQLLEPEYNSSLVKAMYGLLMMLPQSEAFHTLRHRLACIPTIHFKDLNMLVFILIKILFTSINLCFKFKKLFETLSSFNF